MKNIVTIEDAMLYHSDSMDALPALEGKEG